MLHIFKMSLTFGRSYLDNSVVVWTGLKVSYSMQFALTNKTLWQIINVFVGFHVSISIFKNDIMNASSYLFFMD